MDTFTTDDSQEDVKGIVEALSMTTVKGGKLNVVVCVYSLFGDNKRSQETRLCVVYCFS